ncbi:MAG: glycosyltransferase [Eubacterium sp.]|nr:glycosyltransferase [Eubacterium sp.]
MKKVSAVIGLYNSEKTIGDVIKELKEAFSESNKYELEMVLVDDHSPDNVYQLVKGIAKEDKSIKVIHLAKNSGQTNAVIEGYRHATGEYIIEMDDDLQMPAREAVRMVEHLEENDYDVVFAKYADQKESFGRRLGSKINNKMTQIMLKKPKHIRVNSFYVMRKFVKDEMIKYSNHYPYLYGMIFGITNNVANLDVEHRERAYGKSNYTFRKLVGLWTNGFLNFSVEPLRVATKLGTIIASISFVVAIVLIIQRILYPTKSMGWSSLMVTIIFFSGVQLLGMGLLGEYLGRQYISDSGMSRVSVKEKINCEDEEENEEE